LLLVIELTGILGVALMVAFRFGAKRWCAVAGQLLIVVSFALISFALFRAGSYWIAAASAAAVLIPIYVTIRGVVRRRSRLRSDV